MELKVKSTKEMNLWLVGFRRIIIIIIIIIIIKCFLNSS